jgi:diguanylate cyclase (GGDEF)-like protein
MPGWVRAPLIIGITVFGACMLGIYTRPEGLLATVWPANAILLGIMVRWPSLSVWSGWCAALGAYVAADLLAGGTLLSTVILTTGNIVGVAVGWLLFSRIDVVDRRLMRPMSTLYLASIAAVAGATSGLIGEIANPILFGGSAGSGWAFWFATELVNYITFLPVILTIPLRRQPRRPVDTAPITGVRAAPVALLVLSCAVGAIVGGPGAIAFAVPALLWCAVVYRPFQVALLTLLFCVWTLIAISEGYLFVASGVRQQALLISIRMGVTLVALAPITVASVMAAQNDLLRRLEHLARHDSLTGLLNRMAFADQARAALDLLASSDRPVVVMMLDMDHFKQINDVYGHAVGDRVLETLALVMRAHIRLGDLAGRVGGEEFAVLLPDCGSRQAQRIAERICGALADTPVLLDDGKQILATVTIGVALASKAKAPLEKLLRAADEALYHAKEAGRNRIEIVQLY